MCLNARQFYSTYVSDNSKFCPFYDSCSPTLETELSLKCQSDATFGKDYDCGCSNSKISLLQGSTKFIDNVDKESQNMKAFLCYSNQLSTVYQSNVQNDSSLVWQYSASEYGAMNQYPGRRWTLEYSHATGCNNPATCSLYDHRFRPWYISAASAAKSIMLIFDASYHMSLGDRLPKAKEASIELVNGLSHVDQIGVVIMGQNITSCYGMNLMVNADNINKGRIIQCIASISARSEARAHYDGAYRMGFDILDNTLKSTCYRAIILLTAGVPASDSPDPRAGITTRNIVTRASMFTFTFGDDVDQTLPKKIACDNNGLWFHVDETSGDLRTALTSYWQYFSRELSGRNAVWQTPYTDFWLNIPVTSVSQACFSPVDSSLLSVVGLDFGWDKLTSIHANETEILAEITARSLVCPVNGEISLTYLQLLRGGHCNYCSIICNGGVITSVAFSIILLVLVVVVFVGVIFYLLRKKSFEFGKPENAERLNE
jgi:hypothetical protein